MRVLALVCVGLALVKALHASPNTGLAFSALDPRAQSLASLWQFARDRGGYVSDKLEPHVFQGCGVGLRATKPVAQHTLLVSMPLSACMHHDSSLDASDPLIDLANQLTLQMELGSSSTHAQYIESLPTVPGLPVLDYNMDEIKGCGVAEDVMRMRVNWEREFENHGKGTKAAWLWARSIVQSRCYSLNGVVALLPIIDLANHKDNTPCEVRRGNGITTDNTTCFFYSSATYSAGEQVFNSYGDLSIQQKFLSFAWIDPANKQPVGICSICLPFANVEFKVDMRKKGYNSIPLQLSKVIASGSSYGLAPQETLRLMQVALLERLQLLDMDPELLESSSDGSRYLRESEAFAAKRLLEEVNLM